MIKIIFFFILTFNIYLSAQEKENPYKYWLNIGIGGKHQLESSFALNYNFSLVNNYFQAGYHFSGAIITIPAGYFLQPSGGNVFHAANLSIGERLMTDYFLSAAFIGPSVVTGQKYNLADKVISKYTTVGLAFEVQWIFRAANELGIGIEFYGNINSRQSIGAVSFLIYISNNK